MREFLQAHRYGFAAGALLAFLIAILAPGYLIGSAPEDFSFVDPSWLRTFACILFDGFRHCLSWRRKQNYAPGSGNV